MNDEGIEKGALLLLCMGEDAAADVLKHLGPREVQKLGTAMANLRAVPRDRVEEVLDEFVERNSDGPVMGVDDDFLRAMMTKALGHDRANDLVSRILQDTDTEGIESLKWMEPATAADLIKDEHPQIIATILVHLEYEHAGEILNNFTERLRNDVVLRIATLEGVQPLALRELNDSLQNLLASSGGGKKTSIGGVRTAAEILNFIGSKHEQGVIDSVREYDPELAQQIVDQMFTFENLLDVDDRGIQKLLREVQSDSLIIALKGASQDLREKIFKNMSSRAAEMLREDLEAKGPVRISDVENEQKEILKVCRRLSDEGQLMLASKGAASSFL